MKLKENMKLKGWAFTFWICVAITLAIISLIATGYNYMWIDILEEQQEFLEDILHETIKTQSTILRIQKTTLEILDDLVNSDISFM